MQHQARCRTRRRKQKKQPRLLQFVVIVVLLLLCVHGVKKRISGDESRWSLTLVNQSHAVETGYIPPLSSLSNGLEFDARAIGALQTMIEDARAQGVALMVCSAYRSVSLQDVLFQKQIEKQEAFGYAGDEAVSVAQTVVTKPGYSEHNLGLAADIVTPEFQMLEREFEDTQAGQWLACNCQKYGFILRYPEDKQEITGVIYEPWHFRYVGRKAASEIMGRGICLEEYLAMS